VVSITAEERVLDLWSRRAIGVPQGTDSGFVWDDRGHIVTDNHAISRASGARDRLADRRILEAELLGTAPQHHLAVLHVDAGLNTPPLLPVGEGDTLRVGQSVFAIGNPITTSITQDGPALGAMPKLTHPDLLSKPLIV